MKRVIMFSGGVGSWAAAKRVAERHGTEQLTLLFTDTLIEDADLYRFLRDAWQNVGGRLVRVADGRTPWQVFRDRRFLGNTRVDLCSRILKRELADNWLAEHFTPETVTVYVGIDWTEGHRYTRLRERKLPWRYEAPLCEAPYLTKHDLFAWLEREGLRRPRLYDLGFAHNNCGGGCVKAGQGHFAMLLQQLPHVFAEWERNEAALRADLGGDFAILRDRSGGGSRPLTLSEFRQRVVAGWQPDLFEVGGCGCMIDGHDDREAA